jgi:hypothetical protein
MCVENSVLLHDHTRDIGIGYRRGEKRFISIIYITYSKVGVLIFKWLYCHKSNPHNGRKKDLNTFQNIARSRSPRAISTENVHEQRIY